MIGFIRAAFPSRERLSQTVFDPASRSVLPSPLLPSIITVATALMELILQPVNGPPRSSPEIRIAGAVLGYMTKMGVSSAIVEAMSETREIRWLSPKQALAMNLVTDPLGKP